MLKEGDCVEVIYSCCQARVQQPRYVIGRMRDLRKDRKDRLYICKKCDQILDRNVAGLFAIPINGGIGQPVEWLRKYEPPEFPGETRERMDERYAINA